MTLTDFQQLGKELYEKLHLPTYPVAITYIKSEDEIPAKAMRPSAMGQKMCICQTFTYARSWGAHVAITAEENFCVPGSAGHKWVDVTDEEFIESQVTQGWHKSREAEINRINGYNMLFAGPEGQARLARAKARIGLVASPLHQALMVPDTVLVFGNGVHITHIIQALCYDYKAPIMSVFEGFGESCMMGGMIPFLTGQPQIVIPGMGDRAFAGITPDEIGIGIPAAKFPVVLEDLFKTGGPMNIGMPFKTMIPTNLTEDITPGFAYLKKIVDEKSR
ncbi:DUF169 domain-containing protein [Desulfosudis oleivorans]|uniref:DUF169 domain-containing protein n=1 Tax=Desulfosudis oleivorans (strain DSM 6200 / JCM 39069 / Hxd3) TaxID=96561 RepID=A8ZSS5_DESOH|nr:DUF169 domain-containing protein [Desulfosudis oleivorans]ABW65988.1 protein of unknown function DUF169 [Desulfosudis oleivorans Hxd3]